MKKNRTIIMALAVLIIGGTAHKLSATGVTKMQFAKGSYCGTYAGDFSGGKRFLLRLGRHQTLISRNTGTSPQLDVYVTGPTGQVPARKVSDIEIHYQTTAPGDYAIMVLSGSAFSSIEFCAY